MYMAALASPEVCIFVFARAGRRSETDDGGKLDIVFLGFSE